MSRREALAAGSALVAAGATRAWADDPITVRFGVLYPNHVFGELPVDEHIVFDGVLYIPPYGTKNRSVTKELGEFALDLGGGYLIHGTPDEETVGQLSTHGCIRMRSEDLAWLFDNIPVGTPVEIR